MLKKKESISVKCHQYIELLYYFFISYVSQSIKYDSDRIFIHFSCASIFLRDRIAIYAFASHATLSPTNTSNIRSINTVGTFEFYLNEHFQRKVKIASELRL